MIPIISCDRESKRSEQARLNEAVGLARAINLDIRYTAISRLTRIRPGSLFGTGKVDELREVLTDNAVQLAIVDCALTPVQQRNLEKLWQTKVLDRTGIILEIFGTRAQTREGTLQVDLAALNYQKGRLVRSWTHLERQRGGGGFLGGPGETQIEADRRALEVKIARLEKQLEQVRRTRSLQRKQRKRQAIPVIALVGYTNAGKTTLFNKITQADIFAQDLLFATLDPTLRRIDLGKGIAAILSDTVGFISDLPTDLIASFRATLEEVTEADIIVHVRDIADPDSDAQKKDVCDILAGLGVNIAPSTSGRSKSQHYVEVWNKIDLLCSDQRAFIKALAERKSSPEIQFVSAETGEGVDSLLAKLKQLLEEKLAIYNFHLLENQIKNLHHAYKLGTILSCEQRDDGTLDVRIRTKYWSKLSKLLK